MKVSEDDLAKLQKLYEKHFGYTPSKSEAAAAAQKLLIIVSSSSDEFISKPRNPESTLLDRPKKGVL